MAVSSPAAPRMVRAHRRRGAAEPAPHRWARRVGWCLAVATLMTTMTSHALFVLGNEGWAPTPTGFGTPGGIITVVPATISVVTLSLLAVVGGLLATRRPANPIGWLLSGCGLIVSVFFVTFQLGVFSGRTGDLAEVGLAAAWIGHWLWWPALGLFLTYTLLLFPTGHLPSRRWRLPAAAATFAVALITVLLAVLPLPLSATGSPNPLGWPVLAATVPVADAAGRLLVPALAALSLAALVGRYRQAASIERQQLRWVLSAVALVLVVLVSLQVSGLPGGVRIGLLFAAVATVPTAITVAVLRYRLYAIDRIVSRAVAWTLLTGLIVGVYLVAVLAGTRALAQVGVSGDLAVAAGTLAAAAAFRPARRRIQPTVDRRFNRAHVDAARTVSAFRRRLHAETDLSGVARDLAATTTAAVQPSGVALWLRPPAEHDHDARNGAVTAGAHRGDRPLPTS